MLSLIARSALVVAPRRRAHRPRADPALGQPGRPADHGPALAERVHDQHDERQVYEKPVNRDKQLGIVPALATEWQQVSPTLWRFKLRPNVRFHDGTPFTADDVVFSMERGAAPTSTINQYATAVEQAAQGR